MNQMTFYIEGDTREDAYAKLVKKLRTIRKLQEFRVIRKLGARTYRLKVSITCKS